jgi:peptidoglycan/LPS O-acetylase OafA/YrhL
MRSEDSLAGSTISSPRSHEYQPAIDGLRGVAVLAVILFHIDRRWLPGGFVGVDIFFVISGYLITSIIFSDCRRNRFSFLRFYQRRIARLLPAFFVFAAGTLVAALFIYTNQDLASAGANLSAAAASLANLKLMTQGKYFVLSPDAQPFLHCWSLSVEEQFYLLFPACFLLLNRTFRTHLTQALIILLVVSFVFCVALSYRRPEWAFYLLPTRAWELMSGAVLATLKDGEGKRPGTSSSVRILGLVLIATSFFIISESSVFPGYLAALPVIGTAFILLQSRGFNDSTTRMLSWEPLVVVGRASYSLYLWHWPIFSFVDYQLFASPPILRLSLKLFLTAMVTAICYVFVERPGRIFLNHPTSQRLAFATLAVSLGTLVPIGISVRRANYVDASFRDVANGGLHFNGSAKNGSVVLMGDSNGAMYGKMMAELAREQDWRLTVISVAAGDPLPHSSGELSPLWLDSLAVVEREKPDFLVLVCNWAKLNGDKRRLANAVQELSPFVHRIVLITQPPELPVTATREGIRHGEHPPFVEEHDERIQRLAANELVRGALSNKVAVVDVECLFSATDGVIRLSDEAGLPLYQDRNHLSGAGAEMVRGKLLEAITGRS